MITETMITGTMITGTMITEREASETPSEVWARTSIEGLDLGATTRSGVEEVATTDMIMVTIATDTTPNMISMTTVTIKRETSEMPLEEWAGI